MLGTLFGLIALIYGLVLRFDPEARRLRTVTATGERRADAAADGGRSPSPTSAGSRCSSPACTSAGERRRLHPLLLVCISAASISWIEAPYDWAMYAQFPAAIPRMPSWWPLNMTWGGLPSSVPIGYISYFVIPALIGAALGPASARFGWRRPIALLTVGLGVGFIWALLFNGLLGARLGVFHYGRVIPGLALFEGTKHQYPVYDAVAMALQMAVFAYLLGRTDAGRSQRHRGVGRLEDEEPPPVGAPVGGGRRPRRTRALPRGLRAPPRHEAEGRRDRRAHRAAVPRRREPAAARRRLSRCPTDRSKDERDPGAFS